MTDMPDNNQKANLLFAGALALFGIAEEASRFGEVPKEDVLETRQRVIEQIKSAIVLGLSSDIEPRAHFILGKHLLELGFFQFESSDELYNKIAADGIDSIPLFKEGVEEYINATNADKRRTENKILSDNDLIWSLDSVSTLIVEQSKYIANTSGDENAISYISEFTLHFDYLGKSALPFLYSKLGENLLALNRPQESLKWFERASKFELPTTDLSDDHAKYKLVVDHALERIRELRGSLGVSQRFPDTQLRSKSSSNKTIIIVMVIIGLCCLCIILWGLWDLP